MDGGFHVDLIDILVKPYGTGLPTDGQLAQSFQSTARAGWPRFSLAVRLSLPPSSSLGTEIPQPKLRGELPHIRGMPWVQRLLGLSRQEGSGVLVLAALN